MNIINCFIFKKRFKLKLENQTRERARDLRKTFKFVFKEFIREIAEF